MEQQSTIEQLHFPEVVRTNPYMLLGALTDSSLLFREILDNSRDELMASDSADTIWLKCNSDFHIVADNGRGINIAISENDPYHRTQMELAVGEIYAGGKYHSDKIAGGLHGVGSSAVNAVSEVFRIACKITPENYNKSSIKVQDFFKNKPAPTTTPEYYLFIEYQKGIKVNEYVATHEDLKNEFSEDLPQYMSTIVGFTSDLSIVKSNVVNFQESWIEYTEFVLNHFFNKKINIYLNGEKVDKSITPYKYSMQKDVKLAHPEWAQVNTHFQMYISFEFNKDLNQSVESGCVNLVTVNRGLHINYAKKNIKRLLKEVFNIQHDVLDPGLFVNVILLANKVGYDSQTKVRLTYLDGLNDEDYYAFDDDIRKIFTDNYEEIKEHVNALNELAATYENLSAKEYIHQMINISSDNGARAKSFQPVKLIDASAPDSDRGNCELFLAEGASASGTIMKVRDPYYHAVMPLKGVISNVSWKSIEEAFENDEIRDIISAIGTGVDEEHDLDSLRFEKIIIATDADKDGCFSGDTKISLCNGTEVPIKELAEKYPNGGFYVYSKDKYGSILPGLVTKVVMTNHSAKVMKVTLDNDEEIICTPNHPFQMKDLSYQRADKLKVGDSLSALYRKYSKVPGDLREGDPNYEFIFDDLSGKYIPTHQEFCCSGKYIEGEVNQVHHIDHNSRNNSPENLIMMTAKEHRALHLTEYNRSEKHKLDCISSEAFIEHSKSVMTNYNKSQEHRELVSEMNTNEWQKKLQQEGKILKTIGKLVYLNLPINSFYYEALRPKIAPKDINTKYLKELWSEYMNDENSEYYYEKYVNSCKGITLESEIESQVSQIPDYAEMFLFKLRGLVIKDLELTYENFAKVNGGPGPWSMTNGKLKLYALLLLSTYLQKCYLSELTPEEISTLRSSEIKFKERYDKGFNTEEKYFDKFGSASIFHITDFDNWINHYNHKVKSIEYIEDKIPVYNMEVAEYHNYALTAGVFVHNCHIAALLLGIFASFMKFLVEEGHIYILVSPFYKQDGKFIYPNESESLDKNRPFERFKGLGSLSAYNADGIREIKDIFINPETRHLIQVTPENIELAIMTLGDKATRRYLMEKNGLVAPKFNDLDDQLEDLPVGDGNNKIELQDNIDDE